MKLGENHDGNTFYYDKALNQNREKYIDNDLP